MAESGAHLTVAESGPLAKPLRLPLLRQKGGRVVEAFRRQVEAAVLAQAGGVIGISAASRIHTACVALRRWLAVERRLRDGADKLPLADWLALADRSVRYKAEVDRSLTALGLDTRAKATMVYPVYDDALAQRLAQEKATSEGTP